jgi:hypothetical protein
VLARNAQLNPDIADPKTRATRKELDGRGDEGV